MREQITRLENAFRAAQQALLESQNEKAQLRAANVELTTMHPANVDVAQMRAENVRLQQEVQEARAQAATSDRLRETAMGHVHAKEQERIRYMRMAAQMRADLERMVEGVQQGLLFERVIGHFIETEVITREQFDAVSQELIHMQQEAEQREQGLSGDK